MGTAISLDIRDPDVPAAAVDRAFEHLRDIDARFSTYRPDSEVSRLRRGEIAERDCNRDVREVLARCAELRLQSDGYFDIRRHRPDGGLDPSGYVKGWAAAAAAAIIDDAGGRNYCLNAGGDVIARGEPEPGRAWRVGIRHPRRADRVAAVLAVRDLAVATSGAYERGDHILDPHTGGPPRGLLSMTVVGPGLADADVFATIAFAMGQAGLEWVIRQPGYGAYAITDDDRVIWTPVVEPLLVRDESPARDEGPAPAGGRAGPSRD